MASSGTAAVKGCGMQDDDESAMSSDGGCGHDHQPYPQNIAPIVGAIGMVMAIESSDGDADEELSDVKEGEGGLFWESDEEMAVLATPPPQRRNRRWKAFDRENKKYASETEAQEMMRKRKGWGTRRRRMRRMREGGRKGVWDRTGDATKVDCGEELMVSAEGIGMGMTMMGMGGGDESIVTEESEGGGGGGGVVVITRPKGGMRSLCMDMEEVKACKDLGFELEHQGTLEIMPSRLSLSLSGSNIDTSSDGNSPIANWRISSPGDDPKDVKARLRLWAQAVALASTTRHGC